MLYFYILSGSYKKQKNLLCEIILRYNLQLIAMVLLISTLVFFSAQLRDDPLPTTAVAVQDVVSKDVESNIDGLTDEENGYGFNCEKPEN